MTSQTLTHPTFDTMRFIAPELADIKEHALKIGLPPREAEKFHAYFESNGWMVGRTKMKRWHAALTNWKLRWEERQPKANGHDSLSGAQIVLFSRELERVQTKLEDINYTGHTCGWTPKLKEQWYKLVARKKELKKLLGITL